MQQSVRIAPLTSADFAVPSDGGQIRVIGLVPDQVVTTLLVEEPTVANGKAVADPGRDLVKIAVVERHLATGRVGLGFVHGVLEGMEGIDFANKVEMGIRRNRYKAMVPQVVAPLRTLITPRWTETLAPPAAG